PETSAPEATSTEVPPTPIEVATTTTEAEAIAPAPVAPRYRWRARDRYATAKDAFAIVTPLPDGSQVVGHPALADPDAELALFQVKSSGDPFQQTDLARLLPPGQIAIVACAYYPNLHQNEIPHKRNVGHAGLAVGVERPADGQSGESTQRGVMTINNPQTYLGGSFAGGGYGSFFIQRLKFPATITPQEQAAYEKNILTMTALANTFIPFAQENFNGSDPLGIHNEAKIHEAGDKLILAVYGDEAAQQWLRESQNTAYCAELVSAGINTGTTTILSRRYIEALRQKLAAEQGVDRYPDLYDKVSDRINRKTFLAGNANRNLQYVPLGMVDEAIDLRPIQERCPEADQSGTGLAFMYYEFSDIAYGSIRDTYPRQSLTGLTGAALQTAQAHNALVAQVQITAFKQAAEKFKGLANLDAPTTQAFNRYVDEVAATLARPYESEAERHQTMSLLVQQGRRFTPTGPNGEGMFIPPDLYLLPTTGWAAVENIGVCFFPENLEAIA
ncbi:MAG TPA: hypothetical protein V6D02_16105, partial [Candidatus Obscuribacterales bacterium]